MSLNAIMSNALSALQTNTTALNVVSSNISNMNTPGYAQRVVNEETQSAGQLGGVEIADIERVTNQFLTQQALSAQSASSQYSAQSNILSQINTILGQVGSGTDIPSMLDDVFSALGNASLSTSSSTSQQAVLTALNNFASTVSGLSSSISGVQSQVDQQVVTDVGTANQYIQQIYSLNQQIQTAVASGDTDSGLLDQRDEAVQNLSQLMGVSTSEQSDGQLLVSTSDGVNLVGQSTYAQLSYSGGSQNGTYGPITLQNYDPGTNQTVGQSQSIEPDLGSGEIAGLVQTRDVTLADLQQDLGTFAQQTALAFNAQYNANAAYPPPTSLTGRNTGLLSTDGLNFTGQTNIAVTDSSGNLVNNIGIDFDTGQITVNGNPSSTFTNSIGSFMTALNTALGPDGSANFSNGVLSLSATGGNGFVVQDDSSDPSSRGGTSFSQFFGLNDLFQSSAPSITATGLTGSSVGDFSGTISMQLESASGAAGAQASVTLTPGMTIAGVVTALNSAFGSTATFSLSSNGTLTMTPGAGYTGDTLAVTSDSTERGSTGMSLSALFGLGTQQTADQAASFQVNPSILDGSQSLALATPQLSSWPSPGETVVSSGDDSGLLALQDLSNASISFPASGGLNAQTNTLGNYAGSFYQNVSTITTATQSNATAASDQLTEAQSRQSQVSGVDLNTELSNMILYQQAYGAAAHVLQTADQLFTTLMGIQTS